MATKLTKNRKENTITAVKRIFAVEIITTGSIGTQKRDNRYRADRNNRPSELNSRDTNRRRRNNNKKNERAIESDANSKKFNITEDSVPHEDKIKTNEQTNINRKKIKTDNLDEKSRLTDNNVSSRQNGETKTIPAIEKSSAASLNRNKEDFQIPNEEKIENS